MAVRRQARNFIIRRGRERRRGSCRATFESAVALGRGGGDVGRGRCRPIVESSVAFGRRGGASHMHIIIMRIEYYSHVY